MASTSSDSHWKKYVSGYAAAATNTLCTYPFLKISGRQVILDVDTNKAATRVAKEGTILMYRGILPIILGKSFSVSAMFGIHSQIFWLSTNYSISPTIANILGGCTTALIHTLAMPSDRIQTILMNEKYNKVYKNTFDAIPRIYKVGGIKEFYRGFVVTGMRNVASQTSFFVFKHKLDRRTEIITITSLRNAIYFLEGAILSGFSQALFYPLVAMRITMQKEVGGPMETVRNVARSMYEKNRIKAFYRGVNVSIIRSFIGGGIINSSYEIYMNLLRTIFD